MATDTALSYCHDGMWSLQQLHVHSMCLAHTPFSLRPCACDKSTRCTYAHAYASIIMRIQGHIRSIASRLIRFVRNEKKTCRASSPRWQRHRLPILFAPRPPGMALGRGNCSAGAWSPRAAPILLLEIATTVPRDVLPPPSSRSQVVYLTSCRPAAVACY